METLNSANAFDLFFSKNIEEWKRYFGRKGCAIKNDSQIYYIIIIHVFFAIDLNAIQSVQIMNYILI